MELIDFLQNISPWWWLAFAFVLGIIELATFSLFFLWPALSALFVFGVLIIFPHTSATVQLVLFGAGSVTLIILGRYFYKPNQQHSDPHSLLLNNRSQRLIGRTGKVLNFSDGEGTIEIDGMQWHAVWPNGEKSAIGDKIRITDSKHLTLYVKT